MKKTAIILLATLSPMLFAEIVDCKSQPYFSANTCAVCETAGEAIVKDNKIILPETEISWENKSTEMNQNFYQSSQTDISIITNTSTAPKKDLEDIVQWGIDMVWKDIDDVKFFSLATEQKIVLKSIEDKTEIPVTDIKTVTAPHLVVKIPITYAEVKTGSFNESAPKTTNYCVSYTPKVTAPGAAANAATDKPAEDVSADDTGSLEDVISDTLQDTEEDPADIVPEVVEEEKAAEDIPSYDANVTLNSAGADTSLRSATTVETGPEELLILLAAGVLGLVFYPKMNQFFQKS